MFCALNVVPTNLRETRRRAGLYMTCGAKGHYARDCPKVTDCMHALHEGLDPVDIVATCASMQERFNKAAAQ
jgi:hypothetical protein